jgi:hypothetical protein
MLYVNGDSWSFRHKEYTFPIWPELVAEHLGLELCNQSLGCGSNSRIIDCLSNQWLSGMNPSIMIFGLTTHQRYHLPAPDLGSWVLNFKSAHNEHTNEVNNNLSNFFYSKCYKEIDSIYRYYKNIWTIHNYCKKFNSKYLIFQMWDSQLDELNLLSSSENIYNYVIKHYPEQDIYAEQYMLLFEKLKQLKLQWNYIEKPASTNLIATDFDATKHPNKLGHKKLTNVVLDHLERLNVI